MRFLITHLGAGLLLGIVLAACGDDPAGPQTETFTATNVATQNSIDPSGRCAPAQTLNIQGTGTSNLGPLTIEQSHCFDPQGANPLAFYDGEFTNTFADGGSFSGTYSGAATPTLNPAVFQIDAQWMVTGGTGSFASATGGGTASGQANLQTGAGSITLEGTITR